MATRIRTSSRARRLLEQHRLRGRAYPTMAYWDRLYQQLVEEAEKRGKTPPPPPIWHGGIDEDPTEQDRMDRLEEQVAWADHNFLLHRVQMFFDAMPASAWHRRAD
jgi:hypothetical protein